MKKTLHFISLLLLSFSMSFGQRIIYEDFDYPYYTKLTDIGWIAHAEKGVNPIDLTNRNSFTPTGKYATIRSESGESIHKNIVSIKKGVFYSSFILRLEGPASSKGDYFFHLNDIKGNEIGKVFIRKENNDSYQIGLSKRDESTKIIWKNLENYGGFFVIKYSFKEGLNNDEISLYNINTTKFPNAVGKEPSPFLTASDNNSTDIDSLSSISLRHGTKEDTPFVFFGSLKVGTTWESVTQNDLPISYSPVITEPFKTTVGKASGIKKIFLKNSLDALSVGVTVPDGFEFKGFSDPNTWVSKFDKYGSSPQDTATIVIRLKGDKIGKFSGKVLIGSTFGFETAFEVEGEVLSEVIPIAEVRKIVSGKAVTVAGRVTATNQFGSTAYIQDGTAGIAVFSTLFANGVAIGDSVKVSGLMSAFNAQLQIGTSASIVDFTKINVPNKPVTPKVITILQVKDFESQLVTIKDIEFVDKKFIFVPNSNYPIFSGTQTPLLDLRIVNTTNLVGRSKPQSKVAATGIMGLFNTTFQLQPRFIDDLPTTEAFKKPSTGLAIDKSFKLATWNTNWLGNTSNGPTNEALQQRNFQQVLDSLKADVYVLEEVSNLPVFNSIVAKNTNYKGFCTTAISAGGVAADAQRVCFMYKKGVIDSVSARPLLTKATTLPNYPENNPARFWASGRLPSLFIADANIDGVKKRLHIIGIHARANTGGTATTLAAKELQYAQRKYDVEVLKDTLDAQFPNANIILAGDYNDDVDETVSEITSTKESSYKKYVDDVKNYQVITKQLSDNGFRSYLSFNNVIDHITVSNELIDNYVVNSASPEMGFLYITNYASTTSDHLPIYTTFNFEIKSPTELTAKTDTYDKATLTWKDNTNNETGFEIERSTDGTTFAKVGDVAVNIVTFTNDNLKDGVKYFYRLRTVTSEGKSKYSNVAEITTAKILASEPTEGNLSMSISPNPTKGNVRIQAEGKYFDFSLMNLSGKILVENAGNLELINQTVNGKFTSLPHGIYILRMQSGEKNGVLKIIKE